MSLSSDKEHNELHDTRKQKRDSKKVEVTGKFRQALLEPIYFFDYYIRYSLFNFSPTIRAATAT